MVACTQLNTHIMFLTHTRLLAQTQIFSHISFRKKGLETSQLVKRNVQKKTGNTSAGFDLG